MSYHWPPYSQSTSLGRLGRLGWLAVYIPDRPGRLGRLGRLSLNLLSRLSRLGRLEIIVALGRGGGLLKELAWIVELTYLFSRQVGR